jgi:hypothetical protein
LKVGGVQPVIHEGVGGVRRLLLEECVRQK